MFNKRKNKYEGLQKYVGWITNSGQVHVLSYSERTFYSVFRNKDVKSVYVFHEKNIQDANKHMFKKIKSH